MRNTNTLIIGASAAGLACAAQLKKRLQDFTIIEKEESVAHPWRNHYDRLHLHTPKDSSELPFLPFPKECPKYPSRQQVVDYLEAYRSTIGIDPIFQVKANKVYRKGDQWITETNENDFVSKHVIVCTGNAHTPKPYEVPGINTFNGPVIHSADYKNGKEFKGKNVLVVGFGNSACEIAICLHEHGAFPSMSVRSAVNVVPKEILGIPVLKIGIWQSWASPRFSDFLSKPVINLLVGNIEKYGLKKLPYGPREQIVTKHQVPLLDIGTISLIKKQEIRIFDEVDKIEKTEVHFKDGRVENFDAIIAAIGYEIGLKNFIDIEQKRIEDIKVRVSDRQFFGQNNLYFCGFHVSPTGMLREINKESAQIADRIEKLS